MTDNGIHGTFQKPVNEKTVEAAADNGKLESSGFELAFIDDSGSFVKHSKVS